MSRPVRLALALLALGLTLGGVLVGRFGAAHELGALFFRLSHLKAVTPQDLADGLTVSTQREMTGEALLGLGIVLWVVLGAQISRTSIGFTVAAALVALAAGACSVMLPVTRLPAMAYLRAPSTEWPYGIVSLDKQFWNVFIVRSPQNEWAVVVERSSPLGPDGLKGALRTRFGPDGSKKRPVRIYQDMSCPDDIQKVFIDAAHAVADPAAVAVDTIPLPDKENFPTLRRMRREEQLSPYRDILQLGIIAHVTAAAALAFVVWWTPRQLKGASTVTGGNLFLAFGQAVALPVALYAATLPDETGTPDWKRIASHAQFHQWIAYASSAALILGAINAFVGHVLTPNELPAVRPRPRAAIPPRAAPTPEPAPGSPSAPAEPDKAGAPTDPGPTPGAPSS